MISAFSKIWAIDKANYRVKTLRTMVEKAGVINVDTCCGDFLRTDVTNSKFNKVRLFFAVECI